MNNSLRTSLSGQGTVEYLLLTVLVAGIVFSVFQKQLTRTVTDFRSRKSTYTEVVEQRRLGIPLPWFAGNQKGFAGGGSGATNGGANGANSGGDNPNKDSNAPTNAAPTDGSGSPSDAGHGDGSNNGGKNGRGSGPGGGGANAGGSGGAGGTAGDGFGSTTPNALGRGGRGGKSGADSEPPAESEDANGAGGGGRRGGPRGEFRDGSLSGDRNAADKTDGDAQKQAASKKKTDDEIETDRQRALYGAPDRKEGKVGCQNMDLNTILKIGFIIALLFLLISVLLQKKGSDE